MTPHELEQLEARYAALDVTVLPAEVSIHHPAFAAIITAVLAQPHALTQDQMRAIIDAHPPAL